MNDKIPLEIFLPPPDFPHVNLIVAQDHHGLNNGVFFLRICSWTVSLLVDILSYRDYYGSQQLKYRDQTAMELSLASSHFHNGYVNVPMSWFNGYGPKSGCVNGTNDSPCGSLLVHMAGARQKRKFCRWIRLSHRKTDTWVRALQDTHYPKEIEDLWAKERQKLHR